MSAFDMTGFDWVPAGSRVRCTTCGAAGYLGGSWMEPHRSGHPFRCSCGRSFANRQAIAGHVRGQSRFGHHGHERTAA